MEALGGQARKLIQEAGPQLSDEAGPQQYQGDESRNESEQKERVWAYSEGAQQLILNCHAYFKENCPSQPVK